MSLWPILQHRRRNDAHDALSQMPEALQAGASLSAAGSFEHTAELILRQTLDVTGAASAVIFRLDPSTDRLRSLVIVAWDRVAITAELVCTVGATTRMTPSPRCPSHSRRARATAPRAASSTPPSRSCGRPST